MKKLLFTFITACCSVAAWGDNIVFADENVKALCVANWDTNGDGELSYEEAAAVTSLGQVFYNNTAITSFNELQYFTGLKIIDLGFADCSNLANVTIPSSVTRVEEGAFDGTAWFENQPDGLVYVGKVAYKYKGDIPNNTSITLENGTVSISARAFQSKNTTRMNLISVIIPNSVTSIGYGAFQMNYALDLDIPNSVIEIGAYAFYQTLWYNNQPDGLVYAGKVAYKYKGTMPSNTSITLEDGTLGIAGEAFSGCTSLTSINIPNSVKFIGAQAFYGCSSLANVTIPNSMTSIGEESFYKCSGLTNVTIPNSVTDIGRKAFSACSNLTSIDIPNSVTSIGKEAFSECNRLMTVSFPNTLTTIGEKAFMDCWNLTSIVIPNFVTSIGEYAFFGCIRLTSVTLGMIMPLEITNNTFSAYDKATLYVPYGSKADYEAADNWKNFSKIYEGTKISMSANGICTYANANALDFSSVSGLTAYIVSSFNPSTSTLTLTPVTEVPAGEGLLLKGAEGDYEVPFTTTTASYTNLLTGVTTPTEISPINGTETNFILASGKHGIGFYTLSESGTLAAGKAYLHLPTSDIPTSRPITLVYENEPSGIEGICEVEAADGQYFDLQGRRIAQPTKGMYVVNGKKVIIK